MQKYRPSNGTEGMLFMEYWCFKCERDKHEDCPLLANTFAYDVNDPRYPEEWQYPQGRIGEDPVCTEFIPLGDPVYPMRRDLDPRQQGLL